MNTDFFIKPVQAIMSFKIWVSLLFGGVIGGVANTVIQFFAFVTVKALGVKDMPDFNWKSLGMMCLISAMTHAALFLKKSPLPNVTNGDENINKIPL